MDLVLAPLQVLDVEVAVLDWAWDTQDAPGVGRDTGVVRAPAVSPCRTVIGSAGACGETVSPGVELTLVAIAADRDWKGPWRPLSARAMVRVALWMSTWAGMGGFKPALLHIKLQA